MRVSVNEIVCACGWARQQRLRHGQSRPADDRQRRSAREKIAPRHQQAVAVLVVEIEDALVDLQLRDALMRGVGLLISRIHVGLLNRWNGWVRCKSLRASVHR